MLESRTPHTLWIGILNNEPYLVKKIAVCLSKMGIKSIKSMWRTLRELSGDDAYERYIKQHAVSCQAGAPLTHKKFFLQHQKKKWGGIQRCC